MSTLKSHSMLEMMVQLFPTTLAFVVVIKISKKSAIMDPQWMEDISDRLFSSNLKNACTLVQVFQTIKINVSKLTSFFGSCNLTSFLEFFTTFCSNGCFRFRCRK